METPTCCPIWTLAISLLVTGCVKEKYPLVVPMVFFAPVTITPASRTIARGDTLWLTASFSDSLLDNNSGRRYRVRTQDFTFVSGMYFELLQGIGQQPTGIAGSFQIVAKTGKAQIVGGFTGVFEPVYDGHFYRAKIGLIPTQPGIIAISFLLGPSGGAQALNKYMPFIQLPPDAEGRERKALLEDMFYVINDGKTNNFDLYSQYTRAFSLEPGTPSIQVLYETKSTFTVEVK